jgi:hypothetical protein|tara:strand:- start:42 stop:443 length:402 start_codon:yes stop_codon:yes gene_type:complete
MDKRDYRQEIEDFAVDELGVEEVVIADGLEEAFLGIAAGFGGSMVPVYSYDMCIQILMRDHEMDYDDAIEYFEYNTIGAYYSDVQPIYLHMSPSVFKSGVKPSRNAHLKPRFTNEIDNCPEGAPNAATDWLGL